MAILKFRYLICIILLIVTASIVNILQYDSSKENDSGLNDLQRIPMKIGKWWEGKDFPLEELVYEILETRAIVHRSYANSNEESVFLSIVHYHDTKVDFHAPEACLGGEGFKTEKKTKTIILSSGDQKIALEVSEIITSKDNGQTLAYYFYKSGKYAGSNYIKMRLSLASNKLFKNDTRGSLIRISTKLTQGDTAQSEQILGGFLEDLYPYVIRFL